MCEAREWSGFRSPDTCLPHCPARADTALPWPLFLRGRNNNSPAPMPLPAHFFNSPCPHESISSISPKPVESGGWGRGEKQEAQVLLIGPEPNASPSEPLLWAEIDTLAPEVKAFLEANQKADGYPSTWWGTPISFLIWLQECFKAGAHFASSHNCPPPTWLTELNGTCVLRNSRGLPSGLSTALGLLEKIIDRNFCWGIWQAGHEASGEKHGAKVQRAAALPENHSSAGSLLFPCPQYLEESESCPLEFLCTLRRLDEPHEASFPDLQDKKWGGDMLWEDPRMRSKRGTHPLIFSRPSGTRMGQRPQALPSL